MNIPVYKEPWGETSHQAFLFGEIGSIVHSGKSTRFIETDWLSLHRLKTVQDACIQHRTLFARCSTFKSDE